MTGSVMKKVLIAVSMPRPIIIAHMSMGRRFEVTARTLVVMAVAKSMSRSTSRGKEMTVTENTIVAMTAPTKFPSNMK